MAVSSFGTSVFSSTDPAEARLQVMVSHWLCNLNTSADGIEQRILYSLSRNLFLIRPSHLNHNMYGPVDKGHRSCGICSNNLVLGPIF